MGNEPKNKFTLKIVLSYAVLAILALVAGYFILSEIRVYLSQDIVDKNDAKLLKTNSLLTQLYEAESLSKRALQTKTKDNFSAYASKIDTIYVEIDSLQQLTDSPYQQGLLDSVRQLLSKKVANSNILHNLKVKNNSNNYSIENALKEFDKIEESIGKFSAENLFPNFEQFSPKVQNSLREYADLISKNTPTNSDGTADKRYIDSILSVSKSLLTKAKLQDSRTQRSLAKKEIEISQNDLELSQQLRSIISAFEKEVIVNTYNDNLKKKAAVRRSIRLAGFAALLGFIIVGIFTFLINRDFWKIQTYRQKLEKEKKFSESLLKSREQLISTVSHDLRTPLNTITGYSELIENTQLTAQQRSYLKNVKSASHYVDSLVNDLLDFSRLEAGKIKIEKIPFIFSELIRETVESMQAPHKNKPIELILDIEDKLYAAVLGDPFRIRQILTNLVSNAFKFTPEGFIKVTATVKKEVDGLYTIQLSVADSGIGIKREKQMLIFKEFTQADDHTEKKYGGYGLGLTISKKLTELLGGSIQVKSEEGKGSTFTVVLPLEVYKGAFPETHAAPVSKTANLELLIFDDDASMLQLLEEVCASMGIKTHAFSDFTDIDKLKELHYDAVLTDIQMPTTDGFGVLQKLRSEEYLHYGQQPVIAMTGRRDLGTPIYRKAGFTEILQKPFTKSDLVAVLEKLFPEHVFQKKVQTEPKIAKIDSNLFNLEIIHSFLGENREIVDEVLLTFLQDTETNLKRLSRALKTMDYKELNDTCHKMLPMFRQLSAKAALPDLEYLETLKPHMHTSDELKKRVENLNREALELMAALREYLSKSPSYTG